MEKREDKLHRKILEEKAKFVVTIDEYNRAAPEKLLSADTILASGSYAWPWVWNEHGRSSPILVMGAGVSADFK